MDRIETPVILLSAVIVIVNIATIFEVNIQDINKSGFSSVKPSDSVPYTECAKIRSRAQCSSSYAPNYINSLSKCGKRGSTHINYLERQCRQNDDGEYCGALVSSSSVASVIMEHCTDSDSCTTGCADILRTALKLVGCCFNDSAFATYYNACDIALPPLCPASSLVIPDIIYEPSCSTSEEFSIREYVATCENMAPVLQGLNSVHQCRYLARQYELSCSSWNNQYCMIQLEAFNKKTTSAKMEIIYKAASQCTANSDCSPQCKGSLSLVMEEIGCCINTFDSHVLDFTVNFTQILSDELWETCGLERPKTCRACGMTTIGSLIVLITILISFLSKTMLY